MNNHKKTRTYRKFEIFDHDPSFFNFSQKSGPPLLKKIGPPPLGFWSLSTYDLMHLFHKMWGQNLANLVIVKHF